VILDQLFFDYPFVEKPTARPERLDSQHQIARCKIVSRKIQHRRRPLHAHIPIRLCIIGSELGDIVQHRALRRFRFPRGKRQLIGMHQLQLAAFERPRNRRAADLLPVRPSLFVAHDEVLVIDAGFQMKRQPQAVDLSPPHQTGVTERSIGRDDGGAAHHVVDYVMVGDMPGIG
jgi:hypothetical protein